MWSILFSSFFLSSGLAVPQAPDDPKPAPCCFTNPQYAGICRVEPAADETCGQILEYLNNPQSQGKSYCGNTIVRGGWTTTRCDPEPPPQP
jgi:hypothetical protein